MNDKSLLSTYNSILSKPEKWMYYRNCQEQHNHSVANILTNVTDAFRWIRNYFVHGLKDCLLDDLTPNDHTIHSISTFLLGIRLHKLFGVEEYYKSKWLYYWFLISLYHDAGYNVENDQENYPLSLSIIDLCKKLNVSEDSLYELLNGLPTCESDAIRIDRKLVEKYYDYCRSKNEYPFLNHGIVSGVLLYERLTSYLKLILGDRQSQVVAGRQFIQNDKTKFKIIAESIIHHHIWVKTNKNEFAEYQRAGLDDLCIDHNHRLWYANPLTNLLLFCDSIEPLKNKKLSSKLTVIEILNNLCVTHSVKNNTITLLVNPGKVALVEWLNYIMSLNIQSWLRVDITENMSKNSHAITYQLTK